MIEVYEYFAATDDIAAAAAIRCEAASLGLPSIGMVVGIDPVLQLARLESLLRGVDFEVVVGGPRWCVPIASLERSRGPSVVTVTDCLRNSLAAVDDPTFRRTAELWARARRSGTTNVDCRVPALAGFLCDLVRLAREAAASDRHLYCWMSR
ncbi:hypothetical protein [Nocardia sp. CDC160]|uniref:hypothetical protein n=1 Tax=Nocardia sp. CDC160 TaxID=3112166 RepID=UPI002DBC5D42|nr:hypothetical protein [Nocardia sp. CDC160]MEC3920357.1 hypothetical protein [Nocardia sp. CDC160]